jgi:hypothetical protein
MKRSSALATHRWAIVSACLIGAWAVFAPLEAIANAAAGTGTAPLSSTPRLLVETQVAWQGRNDVQSPNDAGGTRFALDDITGDGPAIAPRVSMRWPLPQRWGDGRHEVELLLAPLRLEETGRSASAIRFEGASFVPGTLRGGYRFDSWRIGWRWRWIDRPELVVRVGATAKIRDAQIELVQGTQRASKDNTGFVPLLHASVERPIAVGWSWAADIDALGGGPGYAIDAGAVVRYAFEGPWLVQGGVRFLDGGADNDEVYAFARFTGLTLGIAYRFQ